MQTDYYYTLSLLMALFMLVVSLFSVRNSGNKERYEKEISQLKDMITKKEKMLKHFKDYAKKTSIIEYKRQDIVLFGPRWSGKTSIVALWEKPWTVITKIESSTAWKNYYIDICKLKENKMMCPTFEVERVFIEKLQVIVHDWPGEDQYRDEALKTLPRLNNSSIIFLFELKIKNGTIDDKSLKLNNEYYSKYFLKQLGDVPTINKNVSKVIITFNKIDLFPSEWTYEKKMELLRTTYEEQIDRIKSIFAPVVIELGTSSRTNENLIRLLAESASVGLNASEQRIFNDTLEEKKGKIYERKQA